jgi:hypothetical protein
MVDIRVLELATPRQIAYAGTPRLSQPDETGTAVYIPVAN